MSSYYRCMIAWTRTIRLPHFYGHFKMDGPHGRHLCLVLVKALIALLCSASSKLLDPPEVRVGIVQVAEVLVELAAAYCKCYTRRSVISNSIHKHCSHILSLK
jgi:hypothetical protein